MLRFHSIAIDEYKSQSLGSRRDVRLATLSQVGLCLDDRRKVLLLDEGRFQGAMLTASNVLMGMVPRLVHHWTKWTNYRIE
jgi:hypothetical protein